MPQESMIDIHAQVTLKIQAILILSGSVLILLLLLLLIIL